MPPPIYKICILGLSGTGKSSMCSQFAIRHFDGVRYFPTNKTQTHFGRIWVAEQAKKRKLEAMLDLEDTMGTDRHEDPRLLIKSNDPKDRSTLLHPELAGEYTSYTDAWVPPRSSPAVVSRTLSTRTRPSAMLTSSSLPPPHTPARSTQNRSARLSCPRRSGLWSRAKT